MNLYVSIDKQDLKEIESNYEKLAGFLTSNFVSFPACAFVLQSIIDAVDEAKEQLEEKEKELQEQSDQ